MSSHSASKPISTRDKVKLFIIGVFVVAIIALMRMDTADWVFKYEDYFIEISETAPPPKLNFQLEQTGEGNIEILLDLENISLVEYCLPKDRGLAKGHAHIFLDGKKYGSFYTLGHTLRGVPKGIHTVTVSLNQPPSHKVLSWKGEPVSVTKSITVM